MKTRRALAALTVAIAGTAAACGGEHPARVVHAGRMGRVEVFEPDDGQDGFVYLFSDMRGWNNDLEKVARHIAKQGAVVVGVDLPLYLGGLAATREDQCHYTVAELEDWSHRLQRELGFERYRSPILAGAGAGATLAHVALAQSPAATLAGAVGVDPTPTLATRVPLCPGAPSRSARGGFAYQPAAKLPGFWQEVSGDASQPALERLRDAVEEQIAQRNEQEDAELADLPLVEIPADEPAQRFAVIYSGDGGWRDLDKQIGEYFAAHGTPTVGVDCLRYFWQEKKPEDVAADLARIIRHYQEAWDASEVVLVGYSFGAGILPFAVNRLPPDVRSAVRLVSLLGVEPRASFEIAVTGWLGGTPPEDAPEVLPELAHADLSRVQCFYGEEEEDTLCTDPALAKAEIIRTEGGHHFDGDYDALAQKILDGASRRAGK